MAPPKRHPKDELYHRAITEVRSRLETIDTFIGLEKTITNRMSEEFCYLQLRMICETIAIACVIAHDDIPETHTKQFLDEYNANAMMKRLAKFKPDFYPQPYVERRTRPSGLEYVPVEGGYLTQSELAQLYHKCGSDVLHRGQLKKFLLDDPEPLKARFPNIAEWTRKIRKLLEAHHIRVMGGEGLLECRFVGPSPGVQVRWATSSD